MELGLVRKIDIDREMQQSYLDYAMSVIVARALPDARDGLKPVQRRILYAMYDMGLRADSAHKKSARIVGEVLGKYHPHGDASVYEAMARMAQDFSMRTMLVDGQGNFGSVDGDPPAAMRYTEARLARPALDLLADIGKETVDFVGNFDDTLEEPEVLPAALPNLLVNGATGIAVGMATSIPPHNLGEVTDALVFMLNNWEKLDNLSVEDLMQFVKGPDFPTGGVIIQEKGDEGIEQAYGSGRGKITIQARVHVEEMERGKNRLIISELPYTVNKASLIERIAELVRDGVLEGITDLRDESDRQGMRVVIELTKNADPQALLAALYKRTPMQSTFSIILLALVDGEPRMLSLKQALKVYLEHRLTVIKRRSEFDLEKARQRAHILEGYLTALKHLDEIIALIKGSPDVETARTRLMKRYRLSEVQSQAILDMQLRRLAALERKKIETEYKETVALIKELEGLLKSAKRMREVAAGELLRIKQDYADRRRTQIVSVKGGKTAKVALTAADLLPEQIVWVGMTAEGHIARTHDDKPPRPSGNEAPRFLVRVSTHDTLYLAAADGQAAAVAVQAVPEAEKLADGSPWHKLSPLREDQPVAAAFSLPGRKSDLPEEMYILTVTRGGMIKKSAAGELPGPSTQVFALAKVNEEDALCTALASDGKSDILLATSAGYAIRFRESEVRAMGLAAAGVNGIKLEKNEEVVGAEVLPGEGDVLLVATDGKAKRVAPKEFPTQGRYGRGVIAWPDLSKSVRLGALAMGRGTAHITLHFKKAAPKSHRMDDAPERKRASRGQGLVEMKPGDAVVAVCAPWDGRRYVVKKEEPAPKPKKVSKPQAAGKAVGKSKAKAKPAAKKKVGKKPAKKK